MRILLTGATGFVSGHLAEALLTKGGVELFGTSRQSLRVHPLPSLAGRLTLRQCDLSDVGQTTELLREIQPERVFHLAGYANPSRSFNDAEAAWAGNLDATRVLYDAVVRWGGKPRILYVSSGLVYGNPEGPDQSWDESDLLRPASPYATSKAAADLMSYQYTMHPGLDIVRVRPFNHMGPRQSPDYAVAHFAQQIAAIEKSRQPPVLETGNLTALRDLTDVRDTVQAYILLIERGRTVEVYNVASGILHRMQNVLDKLLARARVKVEMRQDPRLLRSSSNVGSIGNADKLRQETGWRPCYTLDQSLADVLDYWRQQP